MVQGRPDGSRAVARISSAGLLAVGDAGSDLAGSFFMSAEDEAALQCSLDSAVAVQESPEAAPLGKHEELSHFCTCGPLTLHLRSNFGELVKPRGGCVNRCEYCGKLKAVENCEMLVLDALNGDAPTAIAILGTRTATLDMAAFEEGRKRLVAAVRKRWPLAQYAYEVEFTTGYGPRARGQRRPHWNYFWKGIPRADVDELGELVIGIWCRYVDAEPQAQYVAEIDNAIGLTKYITEHFMKASQCPPKGFRGQRFCCSRGYFGKGITVKIARARARESLQRKREVWKATQRGLGAHDAELVAWEAMRRSASTVWVLTNDRGARVGKQGHDPRRQVLARDRPGGESAIGLVLRERLVKQAARLARLQSLHLVPADRLFMSVLGIAGWVVHLPESSPSGACGKNGKAVGSRKVGTPM